MVNVSDDMEKEKEKGGCENNKPSELPMMTLMQNTTMTKVSRSSPGNSATPPSVLRRLILKSTKMTRILTSVLGSLSKKSSRRRRTKRSPISDVPSQRSIAPTQRQRKYLKVLTESHTTYINQSEFSCLQHDTWHSSDQNQDIPK